MAGTGGATRETGGVQPSAARAPELSPCEWAGSFGVARGDITPPVGIYARTWGSARHEVAVGVHRPLLATALALADARQSTELVLLTLDLSWWRSKRDEWELRAPILERTGLEPEQLIFHPSHTHAAPPTAPELTDRPGGSGLPDYRTRLIEQCVDLIGRARRERQPGVLSWTQGSCKLAFNRNYTAPGTDTALCGINPDVPADDTLLVGRITDQAGRIRAVLVNYACHPTSLGGANQLISPDYVGALREVVETGTGAEACIFLHGASGDLTPRRSFESDVSSADANGREIAFATLAALAAQLPAKTALHFEGIEQSGTPLAVWRPVASVPAAQLRARFLVTRLELRDLPSAAVLREELALARDTFMRERISRRLLLREMVGEGAYYDFPVTLWQVGGAFLVGVAGEAHSSFQQALRARFPGTQIAVLNIVNGYLSYLPPRPDYIAATYQAKVAVLREGSTEQVLATIVAAIDAWRAAAPSLSE